MKLYRKYMELFNSCSQVEVLKWFIKEGCEKYKNRTAAFEDTVLFIACYENEMCAVHSPIGEYIFLTRSAAEQTLKEMEGKK